MLETLLAIEEIKRLKHAYLRMLDLKAWDDIGEVFTDDVVTSYGDGKHAYRGRDAVVEFLRASLGDPGIVSVHQVHHPEIHVHEDGITAEGIWYLADTVINTGVGPMEGTTGFELRGTAFYHDVFVKSDAGWRIRSIGYERVFEEMIRREVAPMRWKSRFQTKA